MAVLYPFYYNAKATLGVAIRFVIALESCAFLISLPIFVGGHRWKPGVECDLLVVLQPVYAMICGFGQILLTLCIMTIIYSVLLRVSWIQRKKIDVLTLSQQAGAPHILRSAIETKAVVNFGLVIGLYALCLCPLAIVVCIQIMMGEYTGTLQNVRFFLTPLALANSAVNPVIYGLRMSSFKESYIKLLKLRET